MNDSGKNLPDLPELSPDDFATVLKALQTISCQSDVAALLDCALRVVMDCSGARHAYFLLSEHHQLWLAGHASNIDAAVEVQLAADGQALPAELPQALLQEVLQQQQNLIIGDLREHPLANDPILQARGAQSILCLPLLRQNHLLGILYLERNRCCEPFSANKIAQLELFIAQTVVALENARLRQHLLREEENLRNTEAALSFKRILLRTLVENCPFRIYAKDVDSRFIFANREVARVMGATKSEQLLGYTDFDFYPPDLAQKYFDDEQQLLRSETPLIAKEEPVIDQSDGQAGWTLTTKVHLRDDHGAILGIVGIGMDITERKLMEEEFKRRNVELMELNEKLSQAHEQLVQSEKLAALGALVAGLAHELNTPISNGMMAASTLAEQSTQFQAGLSQGLKRSALENFMEDVSHASEIMLRNLVRAADLVASFKQISLDQTSAQRRVFSLAEVVAEIIFALSPTIRKSSTLVNQTIDPELRMDSFPGPLGQVLINLINNAILHGYDDQPGGSVQISARAGKEGWLELSVQDQGMGIPQTNINRIFDPFFTTKMGVGSSGLGLNIVHNTVTGLLGGQIKVRSEVNQGTCFTLILPTVAPHKAAEDDTVLLHNTQLQ